jgi:hypothetical protein
MNIRLVDGEGRLLDELHSDESTRDQEMTPRFSFSMRATPTMPPTRERLPHPLVR